MVLVKCLPFKPLCTDRVHDYVRGEEVGQTIAVPTYAACDVHGLEKEIQLKARASGKAYVRLMEAENVSPIVLGILQGAFSFAVSCNMLWSFTANFRSSVGVSN